jgi:putative tryptophan/tyrosine transport system substrate-binding protein
MAPEAAILQLSDVGPLPHNSWRQQSGGGMRRRKLLLLLGAMTAARAVYAQQKAIPVIGYLSSSSPGAVAPLVAAFQEGLGEAGYVEGQNLTIEYRWADAPYDRLPALAADLVGRNVDLIVAAGGFLSALAAKGATSTIPIVFTGVSDPVAAGLVASLARPGGNLTGFSPFQLELMPKRLELLTELVPQARVIALLVNPIDPNIERFGDVQEAARTKGVQLSILKASTPRAKSTPPSRRSFNGTPARSWLPPSPSSTAGASSSWRWHRAMSFQRSMDGANSPLSAA